MPKQYVTVEQLLKTLNIKLLHGSDFVDSKIHSTEVSRPGLVLTGYTDFHPCDRIQLLGKTEMTYLETKTSPQRSKIFKDMCSECTPAVILARDYQAPEELVEVCDELHIPILGTKTATSRVLGNVSSYLEGALAPRKSMHGVFLEVYGLGVFIVGESGIGKSEIALELVHRGHRLIADDRADFFMLDELTVIGEAPEILENLIEVRGLGIIDVMNLYGVSAVRRSKRLELIVELVVDDGSKVYDRLGYSNECEKIFDVEVPKVTVPVRVGRNLSNVIEAAAMNFRAEQMGYSAVETFNEKLNKLIAQNAEDGQDE